MTRCDYDAVFYRVFCITLLAIAFTFTIILTNVFIDIDGLLANKQQGRHKPPIIPNNDDTPEEFTPEPISNDDLNYGDNEDAYRTKRSIETQNFLFRIKNPKIKNILTNRLSHLLEALDAEESHHLRSKEPSIPKEKPKDVPRDVVMVIDESKEEKLRKQKEDDMLHLTMHNILLQGIIGHMNMNDVYKRVNSLMHNFNKDETKNESKAIPKLDLEETKVTKPNPENKLVSEMMNCHHLQDFLKAAETNNGRKSTLEILNPKLINPRVMVRSAPENIVRSLPLVMPQKEQLRPEVAVDNKVGSDVMIKTVIDIKSFGNNQNNSISKDNVHGIIELIFNGKSVKFTHPDTETKQNLQKKPMVTIIPTIYKKPNSIPTETTTQSNLNKLNENDLKKIPKDYLNRFVAEYFKNFPLVIKEPFDSKDKNETKRLKRSVKVKNNDKLFLPAHQKMHTKNSTDEDDVYVEIETHFDSKGIKGEKKKKLVKSLIEKIQKAINSGDTKKPPENAVKKKKNKIWRVKKRQQNPLEYDKIMVNKISIPMNSMVHRQLNPITILKTIPKQESSISVQDKSGDSWKREYVGPTFLAATKAINSAEMSELDIDYKNVMSTNGIPQRLQKPLNTDMSEETMNPNAFYDLGIENVIKSYQQTDDQQRNQDMDVNWRNDDRYNTSLNKNDHIIVRRSINQTHDYHSNEYKIIYDGNALPYHNYKDIFRRGNLKSNFRFKYNDDKFRDVPVVIDDNIFDKNLKPAEIFGLANMFHRKKRSLNVKRISNLRSKIRLNRYLNTKAMSSKTIFLNNRRNKRQINKIRIIASDFPHKHTSDENVYVVSDDENLFADRAIVKDAEKSEQDHEPQEETEFIPYHTDFHDDTPTYRIFDGKSRHNALMSKYPHVFMEEITRSREDFSADNALLFRKLPAFKFAAQAMELDKIDEKNLSDLNPNHPLDAKATDPVDKAQRVQEIVNALQMPKNNYKVTLKITPKNATAGVHGGFKEVHTSINKRFNKNGLQYLSLVNVSEISKIININNKTKDDERKKEDYYKSEDTLLEKKMNDQQDKMQLLLREHQKNIDEQLNRLNEEKVKIESILVDDNNTIIPHCDYLDSIMQMKPHKHIHREDNTEKYATPPQKIETEPVTTTTTIAPTIPTVQQTLPPTIITTPTSIFNEKLKKKILHTIERNENLTDQILKKIDKNTEILQSFLKKLTDKIDVIKPVERKSVYKEEKEDKTEKNIAKFDAYNHFPNDWRPHASPLSLNPNYFIRRNESHVPIPFVYAYQQPMSPHKINTPVASVVYHGHIHTNTIHTRDTNSVEKDNVQTVQKLSENNQTRFFIDEIESDYKVIPMNSVKTFKIHKNATIML